MSEISATMHIESTALTVVDNSWVSTTHIHASSKKHLCGTMKTGIQRPLQDGCYIYKRVPWQLGCRF